VIAPGLARAAATTSSMPRSGELRERDQDVLVDRRLRDRDEIPDRVVRHFAYNTGLTTIGPLAVASSV